MEREGRVETDRVSSRNRRSSDVIGRGPRAHGRDLFSLVAPDRDPIRVLSPFSDRRRSYHVHVRLPRGGGGGPRRGRGRLPRREMRPGDQRHRDTGSPGRAGRARDQRDAEIP